MRDTELVCSFPYWYELVLLSFSINGIHIERERTGRISISPSSSSRSAACPGTRGSRAQTRWFEWQAFLLRSRWWQRPRGYALDISFLYDNYVAFRRFLYCQHSKSPQRLLRDPNNSDGPTSRQRAKGGNLGTSLDKRSTYVRSLLQHILYSIVRQNPNQTRR